MSDIVLLIDRLYCIDLFSCIAASLFNKLTYLHSQCIGGVLYLDAVDVPEVGAQRHHER